MVVNYYGNTLKGQIYKPFKGQMQDVPSLQAQIEEIHYYFQEWGLDNSFLQKTSDGLDWVTYTDIIKALRRMSITQITCVYRCLQRVYEDSQKDGGDAWAENLVLHAIFEPSYA